MIPAVKCRIRPTGPIVHFRVSAQINYLCTSLLPLSKISYRRWRSMMEESMTQVWSLPLASLGPCSTRREHLLCKSLLTIWRFCSYLGTHLPSTRCAYAEDKFISSAESLAAPTIVDHTNHLASCTNLEAVEVRCENIRCDMADRPFSYEGRWHGTFKGSFYISWRTCSSRP